MTMILGDLSAPTGMLEQAMAKIAGTSADMTATLDKLPLSDRVKQKIKRLLATTAREA